MATMNDGTAGGMLIFLNWMVTKGLVKAATGNSYRSAVTKVLEIEGEDWETTDVRTLDVGDHITRFENVSGQHYTPGSLATYQRRFEKALDQYLDYLKSPSTFKPSVTRRRRKRSDSTAVQPHPPREEQTPGESERHREQDPPSSGTIEYEFPLRSGETAYIRLPRQFKSTEVDRLASFLRALAFDPEGDE